jgi:hypothetical protein
MAQRGTLEQAARLTGRAEKTLRAWLLEEPPALSVIYGHWRGGVRTRTGQAIKGRTRLLEVDELEAVNAARGGAWHAEYLPPANVDDLAAEIASLKARLTTLERTSRLSAPGWTSLPTDRAIDTDQIHTPLSSQSDRGATYSSPFMYPSRPRTHTRPLRPQDGPLNELAARPLPAGWIAVSTWCDNHGLNSRSVLRQAVQGRILMPVPEHCPPGEPWGSHPGWRDKWYPVVSAYRDDQLTECVRVANIMWPERWHSCQDPHCPCEKIAAEPAE